MAKKWQQIETDWHGEVPRSIRKQAVSGLALMILCFGGFGAWAFRAPLAAAVITQGSFVATGQNKIVQHLEGGIIKDILVNEGDQVRAGQPLVTLDETAARGNNRQLFLRLARLESINARLDAEQAERELVQFPEFLVKQADDAEVASILASQMQNFTGSRAKLQSDLQLLQSNIKALEFRANGYDSQRQSMETQLKFLKDELAAKSELLNQGLIRRTETNALSRAIADAQGQIGRLGAEVSETKAEATKFESQISQTRAAYRQAALDEMQKIEAELDSVREQQRSTASVLKRASIDAPVSGVVIRLYFHTPGGIIESGKSILEILPTDVPLIVETQIPRNSIDVVRKGQHASVRLIALNQRTTPILNGQVEYVSADSIIDPKLGAGPGLREFYIARVSLPANELSRVSGFSPTPGMPAEVMIQTAERTFVDYLTKPISDSMSRAFRED
jgi:HlyD family type I secretion membrane fusion protein